MVSLAFFKRGKDSDDDFFGLGAQPEPKAVTPENPGIQVSQPHVDGEHLGVLATASSGGIGHNTLLEHGTLKVLVLDAKDLIGGSDVKPYAIVRIGDKEYKTKHAGKTVAPEWNETFDFPIGPTTSKLHVSVFDHKTLGKDKSLGEAEVDILQYVQTTSHSAVDVSVEIKNGSGVMNLRLDFRPEPTPIGRKSSVSSPDHGGGGTLTSPSRFSLRGRRPAQEE